MMDLPGRADHLNEALQLAEEQICPPHLMVGSLLEVDKCVDWALAKVQFAQKADIATSVLMSNFSANASDLLGRQQGDGGKTIAGGLISVE